MKYFSLYISLVFFFMLNNTCTKELPPKPDNYTNLYTHDSTTNYTIPCEDNLQDNYYTTDQMFFGFNSFYIYDSDGRYNFDTYEIIARHAATPAMLIIEIEDNPNYFRGRKVYNISKSNYASSRYAKIAFDFNTFYYTPVENNLIYVDFTDSTLNISLCEIKLNSDYASEITVSGRIIHFY